MARRHRSRKARKSRKSRKGGSGLVGALRTALFPFLLYKGQKAQQKRVSRAKTKIYRKKRGGKRKGRKSRRR